MLKMCPSFESAPAIFLVGRGASFSVLLYFLKQYVEAETSASYNPSSIMIFHFLSKPTGNPLNNNIAVSKACPQVTRSVRISITLFHNSTSLVGSATVAME